jgi:hypothetical protein
VPVLPFGRLRCDAPTPAPWRDGLCLALLCGAAFVMLAQRKLHGLDVPDFINWLQLGKTTHHIHYLYMPLMDALHRVGRGLGATPHQTLLFASGLGGALAVLFLHRAGAVLGLRRPDAALAAALAASAPAVVFFATVAEIHAVFYAFFGLACWQWARTLARPGIGRAAVLGVCTALAAAVHATGHLLLGLLPLLTLGLRPRGSTSWLAPALAFLLAHAGASVGLDAWLRASDIEVQRQGMIGYLRQCLTQLPLRWNIVADVWREWVWPFLPLSLVPIAGLFVRATRRFALACCAAAAVFLAMTVVLLFGKWIERGAYQLPLAWPAALLLLALAPRALQGAALVLAAGLATWTVRAHDQPYENPQLVADLAAAAQDAKLFVVCADLAEYEPLIRDLPSVSSSPLMWLAQLLPQGYDRFVAHLDNCLGPYLGAGYAVVFTERAFALLSQFPEPTLVRVMREHFPAHYTTAPFRAGAFAGVLVRVRT